MMMMMMMKQTILKLKSLSGSGDELYHAGSNVWVCMCGFCNMWVCVCVGFVLCGCVGVCMWGCFDKCVGVLVICVLVFIVMLPIMS